MSNTELVPSEMLCGAAEPTSDVEILVPRDVPLGGPRAMNVRRTLPQRQKSLIGAWCFLDHYGPDQVADSGGMKVPRHPHTGLQTVSWLFTGEVEHRDTAGYHAIVRPGELNLMTAGYGISHSEFSTEQTQILHGAQLWIALPEQARHKDPGFEHYGPEPIDGDGWTVRVFLGSLAGSTSPVATHTALLGAEILVDAGAEVDLDINAAFEHGVLLDAGELQVNGHDLAADHLAYLPVGSGRVSLKAGSEPVCALLIGGEPLGEQIVMWWNFVGRSHEEIVEYRAQWQQEIGVDDADAAGRKPATDTAPRFGSFPADQPSPLPAPALPNARMRLRG
ncbi:pirin family protein [Arthrobacter castelli]|uniref:pirin family protein n=1 Tax=Arthrobacter castelli TaxID=271431 RepID=UPI000400E394|nr:pirin family protein [Arthrobacter castelli]